MQQKAEVISLSTSLGQRTKVVKKRKGLEVPAILLIKNTND